MFKKILVANRGEIAIRIMRTCRELGIKSVAIYSSADENALHRYYADEAYYVGKADPKDSYLNIERIVEIAKKSGAEAIHPGYGFISENPLFAKRCEEEGIVFIGPPPKVLEISGSKIEARKRMRSAGVPIVPGSPAISSLDRAFKWAEKIGYPVAVKASAGGGGIGITVVRNEGELESAFTKSKTFGEKYFKDPTVYIEKWLSRPRHIEVQILGDDSNVVQLGERECSIQRRNQKLIEETPSPALNEELREKIGKYAVKGAKSIGYKNAGTFEFLYSDGNFYFLEINARLQVEHTITEIVTGVDIVREQIRVAYGEGIGFGQEEVERRGHAMELRIYAEDPVSFLPSGGRIEFYRSPGGYGVRLDSAVSIGSAIPEDYDPMISKLTVFGRTRAETIARGKRSLMEYIILGVTTNIPLHLAVLSDEEFERGNIHTKFLEERRIHEKVPYYIERYLEAQAKLSRIFMDYESEKIKEQLKKAYRTVAVSNGEIEERLWKIYTSLGH
ncbi:MAG: acetyl-CoA carboxylase biotin carboxylase subunit [Archaeoglobi archaeon]|nr:MAG: acetyl-CoA carboxylase biotin carboxylase subunit [Archaeoglobi archaeon]TDA30732.1 MAG: acetyl-CoA carboxylase biotin carboxylase subunit [Archaeoglobi archaeon]